MVRKFQAFAAAKAMASPSSSTAAYCKARQRFPTENLEHILDHTTTELQRHIRSQRLNGRRVIVVDGTGLSMPDTPINQARWPQQSQQKPGCGFPQARLSACFCLQSGALLSYRLGNRKQQELPLLRDLKTTMGMDILRCKTPAMVEKEILMHLIVYNYIRLLMNQAAEQQHSEQREISFKAAVQAFR